MRGLDDATLRPLIGRQAARAGSGEAVQRFSPRRSQRRPSSATPVTAGCKSVAVATRLEPSNEEHCEPWMS